MNGHAIFSKAIQEHDRTMKFVGETIAESVARTGEVLAATLANGGTILWCGNGGSAADSQHLAAEFSGRFRLDRRPLRAVALTTDSSALTCIANDFGFADVFARQVEAVGRPGDALVVISTSGNSENIRRALRTAREFGIVTVALLGKGGGPAAAEADHAVIVPADSTARIQEAHIFIGHVWCEMIEAALGFE